MFRQTTKQQIHFIDPLLHSTLCLYFFFIVTECTTQSIFRGARHTHRTLAMCRKALYIHTCIPRQKISTLRTMGHCMQDQLEKKLPFWCPCHPGMTITSILVTNQDLQQRDKGAWRALMTKISPHHILVGRAVFLAVIMRRGIQSKEKAFAF